MPDLYIDQYQSIINIIQAASLNYFMGGNAVAQAMTGTSLFVPYYVDINNAQNYMEFLDSIQYNTMQRTLSADLHTLFSHANYIDSLLRSIKEQSVSTLEKVHSQISTAYASADKKKFEIIRNMLGFKRIFYDAFRDNGNMESYNNALYSSYFPQVSHDAKNDMLTAPSTTLFEYNRDIKGNKVANIEIIDRRGITIGPVNALYPPSQAIDGSDDSYWTELILTNTPIDSGYTSDLIALDSICTGAVSVVKIDLIGVKKFNKIRINPFCEYPLCVLGIYAVTTTGLNTSLTQQIVSNKKSGDYFVYDPIYIGSDKTFNFSPVSASAVIVILAQPHYKRTGFRLPKGQRQNYEIFNTIFATTDFGTIDYSKFSTDEDLTRTCTAMAQTMVRENDINILSVTSGDTTVEEYNKLEYNLGAYEIDISYDTYKNISQYISKPIKMVTSIGQVSLLADSRNIGPTGHIEYSLVLGDNTEVPIMPLNDNAIYEYIDNNKLFDNGDNTYYPLRFSLWSGGWGILSIIDPSYNRTEKIVQILSNSTSIASKAVIQMSIDMTGIDTVINQCIFKYPYDATDSIVKGNLIANIEYGRKLPADIKAYKGYHPQYVDLLHNSISSQITVVEENITAFDTGNKCITLRNTPFSGIVLDANGDYNSSNVNIPIVVTLNNASLQYYDYGAEKVSVVKSITQYVTGKSQDARPYTFNKTDYKTRNPVYLPEYQGVSVDKNGAATLGDNYKLYYQVVDNKIYFNVDLTGCTINVRYYKLIDTFRFKATIINTMPGYGNSPPTLNSYALLMNDFNTSSTYNFSSDEFGISNENTSQGSETTIRLSPENSSYSDDYRLVALHDINASPPPSTLIDRRVFNITNSGNLTVKYTVFVRSTVITNNDTGNDTYYDFSVLGQPISSLSALPTTMPSTYTFQFDANNGIGYPSDIDWCTALVTDPVAPNDGIFVSIMSMLHANNSNSQLSESVIKVEFMLMSQQDGLTGDALVASSCYRNGPTYYIRYKCPEEYTTASGYTGYSGYSGYSGTSGAQYWDGNTWVPLTDTTTS